MSRVLFLDIDGVLIPRRAYYLPGQTLPTVMLFDPCAVAMVNEACRKQGRKIVLHTSWTRPHVWQPGVSGPGDVHDHCVAQGVQAQHFHADLYCQREVSWRYHRIEGWLERHPEVDDYFILDDTPPAKGCTRHARHLVLTDFDEGLTHKQFCRIRDGVAPRSAGA